jgi:protocatechuate 3,4-dioxygenase beta subunit
MKSNHPMKSSLELPRRSFLRTGTLTAASLLVGSPFFTRPGVFAEELLTPAMTEGPFYPDQLPLDTDNDLLILNDAITPAVGEITHLTGRVLDQKGNAVRNAVVEIWQCDGNGVYLHSRGGDRDRQDKNFQGFGRFTTNIKGEYYFRTIKPVSYPGRTPHIHFAVNVNNKRRLATQMLIAGHPQNATDGLFKRIRDPLERESILVEFQPLAGSKIGELTAHFDIVIGLTPDEDRILSK